MEVQPPQFVGAPSGHYGSYTFYRGFRYSKNGKSKDLNLGEFFFVRISADEDPCIGELQLLCTNRNNDQQLSALRLYFLPEQTPEGRLAHHGEDEVLVASDRVVLKLDDLVSWITEEVEWNHGIVSSCIESETKSPALTSDDDGKTAKGDDNNNTCSEKPTTEEAEVKEEDNKEVVSQDSTGPKVVVLSYQKYCRYRTILKRIEGGGDEVWLNDFLVIALGGFAATDKDTRLLFCRDTFEHDELAHHELNCEYLAPTVKGKRRKKKTKNTRSTSPESNSSEECKDIELKNNQKTNGLKQPPIKNEQEFLQRLFKFMKKRNTPIHRVPHLGFKQIDLYVFYSFAQKLGGYDKITSKKLWKHVYDELGGNPGSTSAATCTRRHYERLLLPFERFMDGIVYKPAQRGKKSQKKKLHDKENDMDTSIKSETIAGTSAEVDDAYTFTDSNHENSNSKDSNSNEFNSACDEQAVANDAAYSDEDSKTVWSIQKQPDNKDEADKDESKPIKPLIIQKGQSETFAEKERKWDEIRRKNAAARKWVRQSRSSRGCKTPVPDVPHFNQDKQVSVELETPETHTSPQPVKVKAENLEHGDVQNVLTFPNQNHLPPDVKVNTSYSTNNHNVAKFLPTVSNSDAIQNVINKLDNQKRLHMRVNEVQGGISSDKKCMPSYMKSESAENHSKAWCGYSANSEHSSYPSSVYSGHDGYPPALVKGQVPPSYKAGSRSEPDVTRDYLMQHTGRHSVGSMSASSAVSVEISGNDDKPLVPQRRPSVIQHTEYAATSPSPSLSPKQTNSDNCRNISPKDGLQSVPFSSPKINLLPNQLSYSMTGKVAEWLTKGVHEVVACKTPSTVVEKTVELHDKVMMPSSCKTPGAVGTSKIPINNVKNKHNPCIPNCPKSPRSKYTTSHRHRNSDNVTNGNYSLPRNDTRNSALYQKSFHPAPTTYNNSVMTNASSAKYQQVVNPSIKPDFYPSDPYYNQQKRFKCNNMLPSMLPAVNPRPSLLPFARQHTYRTSPLSDIPKTTASTHNDYDSAVLDLSVKKKPAQPAPSRTMAPVVTVSTSPVPEEGVCLDLSIKKKSTTSLGNDNGIENITPPLPLSPNPQPQATPFMHSSLKPLPTLIALQDFSPSAETVRQSYSSSSSRVPPIMTSSVTAPASGPPLVMPPTNTMYPANTHSKIPPGIVNTMPPMAYSKDIAKNLYMPSTTRHSQFSPFVLPQIFQSNWAAVVSAAAPNMKQTNNFQTSPMTYKGMVNHSVFPKDYPSQYKSQFHPVLCKDNGHYPSNGK